MSHPVTQQRPRSRDKTVRWGQLDGDWDQQSEKFKKKKWTDFVNGTWLVRIDWEELTKKFGTDN
jgi:hypothetical protein